MKPSSFDKFFSSLAVLFLFSLLGFAAPAPSAKELLLKIEKRRGPWISFRADLEIRFSTADGESASCRGKMAYHRLDEKILLECFSEHHELLFIFKTLDKNFDLYLPSQRALFRGSIFSLEDSPSIESRLRALDLYRALKPSAIPLDAQIQPYPDPAGPEKWLLRIYHSNKGDPFLARELAVTEEGDVVNETYYQPGLGGPGVRIERSQWARKGHSDSAAEEFFFPHKIRIESNKETSGGQGIMRTILIFQRLEFLSDIPEEEFDFSIPEGTRTLTV